MQVPSFLLRRLYVKGSLRNEPPGFAFDLSNTLGSGYADQVLPLHVDGNVIPPDVCAFVVDGASIRFDGVTAANPMTLGMNATLTVRVDGRSLDPGEHTIELAFIVTGMGEMRFDVKDTLRDA